MIDPSVSHNETIARHAEGDIRLATFGVPPDIIFYRITSRPECEKVSPFLLASPREIPRNGAERQTTQEWGQLLFELRAPRACRPVGYADTARHGVCEQQARRAQRNAPFRPAGRRG